MASMVGRRLLALLAGAGRSGGGVHSVGGCAISARESATSSTLDAAETPSCDGCSLQLKGLAAGAATPMRRSRALRASCKASRYPILVSLSPTPPEVDQVTEIPARRHITFREMDLNRRLHYMR